MERRILITTLCLAALAVGRADAKKKPEPTVGTTPAAASAPAPSSTFSTFRDAYDAGNGFLKDRKFDLAVDAYNQAEKLTSSASAKSQAANTAGWTLIRARRWNQALETLRRAAQIDPKNKVALGNLGYASLKIYQYGLGGPDNLKEAAKALEACSALDPAYKADLLESVKTIQSREDSYAQATPVAETPKAGMSFKGAVALGDQAQAQGQYDLAIQFFKRAEASASSPQAKGSASNRIGLALLEYRRPKEALEPFERAVKTDPKEKVFLNNLGLADWTLYDAGLGDQDSLRKSVDAFYKANTMDASYHGENLKMALDEYREVDPVGSKDFDSKHDPATGEAAPMGSPTTE